MQQASRPPSLWQQQQELASASGPACVQPRAQGGSLCGAAQASNQHAGRRQQSLFNTVRRTEQSLLLALIGKIQKKCSAVLGWRDEAARTH